MSEPGAICPSSSARRRIKRAGSNFIKENASPTRLGRSQMIRGEARASTKFAWIIRYSRKPDLRKKPQRLGGKFPASEAQPIQTCACALKISNGVLALEQKSGYRSTVRYLDS